MRKEDLEEVRTRLRLYEDLTNKQPRAFDWKFTKEDLFDLLRRLEAIESESRQQDERAQPS